MFVGGDPGWNATYRLRLERDGYTVTIAAGALAELTRGEPATTADATIGTDRETLHALLTGDTTVAACGTRASSALRRLLAATQVRRTGPTT